MDFLTICFNIIIYLLILKMFYYYFKKEKELIKTSEIVLFKILKKKNIKILKFKKIYKIIFIAINIFVFWKMEKVINLEIPYNFIALMLYFMYTFSLFVFKKVQFLNISNMFSLFLLFLGKNYFGISDILFSYLLVINIIFNLIFIVYSEKTRLKIKVKEIVKFANFGVLLIFFAIFTNYFFVNTVIPTGSMKPVINEKERFIGEAVSYKFINPKVNDIVSFVEPINESAYYAKRIVGIAGQNIKIDEKDNYIVRDSEKDEKRKYSIQGILQNTEFYIPKKNDEVKLNELIEYDFNNNSTTIMPLTTDLKNKLLNEKEFLKSIGVPNKNGKMISFVLEVKGHSNYSLPILDFKRNKNVLKKLINGETVKLKTDYYLMLGDNTNNSFDGRYFGLVAKNKIKSRIFIKFFKKFDIMLKK